VAAAAAALLFLLAGCQKPNNVLSNLWPPLARSKRPQRPPQEAEPSIELDLKQKADVEMAVGRSLERKGQTDQAVKIYLDVIRKDGRRGDAYHRLAVLYDKKGEPEESARCYREALKRTADNAELYADFGYSCYLQKRWDEAEANLQKALRLDGELTRARNNLGLLLARTGRPEEALAEFRRAGCSPSDAHANLAFAMVLEERWDEARREFELALDADPSSKAAQDGLSALGAMAAKSERNHWAYSPRAGEEGTVQIGFVTPGADTTP
jgi:Tfp pilus assembly protein PilF